jgi:hypothetical protein
MMTLPPVVGAQTDDDKRQPGIIHNSLAEEKAEI